MSGVGGKETIKLTQFYYYNERKTLPVKISNTLQVGKKNYEHFLIRIYLKFFQLKHVKTEIICFFNIKLKGVESKLETHQVKRPENGVNTV